MKKYIKIVNEQIQRNILFYLLSGVLIISLFIWVTLWNNKNMSYTETWVIGVSLFGSLSSGLCTLIAVVVSTKQTNKVQAQNRIENYKQLELSVLNEQIKDYMIVKELFGKVLIEISELYTIDRGKIDSLCPKYERKCKDIRITILTLEDKIICIKNQKTNLEVKMYISSIEFELAKIDGTTKDFDIIDKIRDIINRSDNCTISLEKEIALLYKMKYEIPN